MVLLLVLVDGKNTMSVRSVWCLGGIYPLRDQSMLLVRSNVLPAERPAKITTYSSMNSLSIAESNKDFGMMGEVISWQSRSQNSKLKSMQSDCKSRG